MLRLCVAKCRHFSYFPVLLLAFTTAGFAQTNAGWDRVKQLPPGAEIRLNLTDQAVVTTEFQSATDDAIMVAKGAVQQTVSRAMIRRVSLKGESHRVRHVLIGLGAGAATGLVVGAVIDSHDSCKGGGFCLNFLPNAGKEVFTPLGGLVGTLVGALIPSGGWHEVYRSK
jgi:hypothetical protein